MNQNQPPPSAPPDGAPDNAGVRVPPPLIFVGFLLVGLWADSAWVSGHLAGLWVMIAGGGIALAGLALILAGGSGLTFAGSKVEPWKPTTAVVTSGPYAYTRNPIYLGMAIMQVGLATCGGSLGGILSVALSIWVVQAYVIAKEETYLEAKFGELYTDYTAKVRRWI